MGDRETSSRVGPIVRARRWLKAAAYSGPGRDRWQQPRRVLDVLELREGMRVADIGAGGGYFTFRLARAVGPEGRVFAVDTDLDMRSIVVDRARKRHLSNVTPIAPAEDDPQLPEPVDLALIVDAFHHLPEPASYLRTLVSQLAPTGRVAVIEPPPKWYLFGHATDPAVIQATLEDVGLAIEVEHDFLRRQAFVVGQLSRSTP